MKNIRQHIQADNISTKQLCFALCRMIEARADCTSGVINIDPHASITKENDATGGMWDYTGFPGSRARLRGTVLPLDPRPSQLRLLIAPLDK
jgi:hypothetical protein